MNGMRLSLIAMVCFAVLAFVPPAAADFVGLDADGDLSCDSTDMQVILEAGDIGTLRTLDLYFDDVPDLQSWGCTFCVKNGALVTNESFAYSVPAAWASVSMKDSDGDNLTISEFITTMYPDYRCYLVQATDWTGASPMSFPAKVGTFSYEVADEGCLGFVIDGPTSGWFSMIVGQGDFGDPGEACDTVSCPSQVEPVVIGTETPACPIPDAMLYENYDLGIQFTAAGGVPPYGWDVDVLPAGMRIVPETGVVEGMPTEFGGFAFQVRVTDDIGQFDVRPCSIYVDKPRIDQTTPSCPVPAATYGVSYPAGTVFQLANSPTQSLSWTATGLPLGMGINLTTGELFGTPTEWGWDIPFTVFLNGIGPTKVVLDQRECSITALPIAIDDADPACPIPNANQGVEYAALVQFRPDAPAGYNNEHRWDVSGLPNGMSIDEKTGSISGTPTEAGDFTFTVALFADPSNKAVEDPMDTRECSITVGEAASITVATLPPGQLSAAPGAAATHSFEVENVAGTRIELSAQARSENGWDALVTSSMFFSLAPGEIETVYVDHVVPAGAECPGQSDPVPGDTLWLDVFESQIRPQEPLASDWAFTTAEFSAGVVVSPPQYPAECADPGDSIYVQIDVHNTGACPEWFDIDLTFDKPGWSAEVAILTPPIWLSAGALGSVPVWVHVPEDAECGEQVTMQFKATGTVFGAADSTETDHCANNIYEVSIRDISGLGGEPGDSVTYCFEVKNEGNCDVIAYPEAFSGWPVNFNSAERLIPVDQSDTICVRHLIPAGTAVGAMMNLTFIVSPGLIPEKDREAVFRPDTLVVTTTALEGCDAGVEITPPAGGSSHFPNELFQIAFNVSNTGGDPDRYLLYADCPQGWMVDTEEDTTPVIDPGNDYDAVVNVQVPSNALCTDQGWVRLYALSLCDPQTMDIDSAAYGVMPVVNYEVVGYPEDSTGVPGQRMEYFFRITNNGNCAFPTGLMLLSTPAWEIDHGGMDEFELGPGEFSDFHLGVRIPDDAVQGDEHKFLLCADAAINKDRQGGACDSIITRVLSGCEHVQPILSLGDYRTVNYTGPGGLWTVQVQLRNNGPGEARNISMEMHENLSWLLIPDAVASYGNLPQGSASYGDGDGETFTFDLSGYPGGSFNVWFDVSYEDACGAPPTYQVRLDPTFLDPEASAGALPSPTAYVLHGNMPNPFNPSTTIGFELPVASRAELTIYNTAGQKVKRIWSGDLPSGVHTFQWTGEDDRGNPVPSGTYFYSLKSGDFRATKRMVLVR
ncbi:MAG: putative Ig domain-containing protein [Candidatus Eisenbacteria bacterium]|nr:putative Ig domain-containing protein [Candidatus Eisenbacteria bacterium]